MSSDSYPLIFLIHTANRFDGTHAQRNIIDSLKTIDVEVSVGSVGAVAIVKCSLCVPTRNITCRPEPSGRWKISNFVSHITNVHKIVFPPTPMPSGSMNTGKRFNIQPTDDPTGSSPVDNKILRLDRGLEHENEIKQERTAHLVSLEFDAPEYLTEYEEIVKTSVTISPNMTAALQTDETIQSLLCGATTEISPRVSAENSPESQDPLNW